MESISSDINPYFSEKLAKLKRKKCREYTKRRRSKRWKILEEKYCEELEKAKKVIICKKNKKSEENATQKVAQGVKKVNKDGSV